MSTKTILRCTPCIIQVCAQCIFKDYLVFAVGMAISWDMTYNLSDKHTANAFSGLQGYVCWSAISLGMQNIVALSCDGPYRILI